MAKRTLKIWGKRTLSLFLTLVMLTSMIQITAFASSGQIMSGYYAIGPDGVATISANSSSVQLPSSKQRR